MIEALANANRKAGGKADSRDQADSHSATVDARGRIGLRGRTGPLTPPSQAQRLRVADPRGRLSLQRAWKRPRARARPPPRLLLRLEHLERARSVARVRA